MTDAADARRKLDMYLGEVRGVLRPLQPAEVDEILTELRSHVLDRAGGEAGLTDRSVEEALAALGTPRVLAAGYLGRSLAEDIEKDRSPLRVLAATYRMATFSVGAFALFLVSLVGYGVGVSLVLVALAKPVFPDKVGMWTWGAGRDFTFNIGATNHPPTAVEHMGFWIIPFGLVGGAGLLYLTWRLGVVWVRALGRKGPKLEPRLA